MLLCLKGSKRHHLMYTVRIYKHHILQDVFLSLNRCSAALVAHRSWHSNTWTEVDQVRRKLKYRTPSTPNLKIPQNGTSWIYLLTGMRIHQNTTTPKADQSCRYCTILQYDSIYFNINLHWYTGDTNWLQESELLCRAATSGGHGFTRRCQRGGVAQKGRALLLDACHFCLELL